MVRSFKTLEQAKTTVYKTSVFTLAAAVCDQLERAGYPVLLRQEGKSGRTGHYEVRVPRHHAHNAKELLFTLPRTGEVYAIGK